MPQDAFDMLATHVEKLSDKVFEIATVVSGVRTQLKLIYGLLFLVISGIVGSWFWFIRQ